MLIVPFLPSLEIYLIQSIRNDAYLEVDPTGKRPYMPLPYLLGRYS